MSETTTQPTVQSAAPEGGLVLTPEQQALMASLGEAANQQDRGRAASGLPTRVASDIWGGIKEAPAQIIRGAMEAGQSVSNAGFAAGQAIGGMLGIQGNGEQGNPVGQAIEAGMPVAPTTVTGGIVNDVSQFVTGLIPAGRILRMAGVATSAASGTVARVGAAAAQGAIADFMAFDPHEERLSNLVERYPALSNPVTQFLAAKEDDGEALGRLKNAIEGLGVGAAADGFLHGLRALRAARRGDTPTVQAATEEMEAAAPTAAPRDPVDLLAEDRRVQSTSPDEGRINDPAQGGLDLEGGSAPRPDSPAANIEANPTAAPTPHVSAAPKLIEMDEAGLRAVVQQNISELGFGQGRDISGIRTDLIESGEDLASLMNSLRVVYREELDKSIGGRAGRDGEDFPVRSLAETRRNADRIADVLADDPDLFWQRMSSIHGTTQNLDAELLVYRDTLNTVWAKTRRLADAVNDPTGTATAGYGSRLELMNQFQRHVELSANVQVAYKGIQTNIARSLNAMRLPAKIDPKLIAQGADAFFEGGEDAIRRMAARIGMADDLNSFNNVVRGGYARNAIGAINEYWINSVLSGPKTHAVNMMSNMATTILQPIERIMAGSVRAGTQQGRQEAAEGALQFFTLALSLKDAARLSYRAFRLGDSFIDPGRLAVDSGNHAYITTARMGTPTSASTIDPVSGLVLDGIGNMVRLPTRLLMAEDEFFKQLTFRARLRAEGLREGFMQHGFDRQRLAESAEAALRGKVDPVTGQALDQRHLRAARDVTFSGDLSAQTLTGGPTWGQSLQQLTAAHPGMTLVLPFIRTPTNIMRFVADRTPGINLLRTQYRRDLMGGNGAEARGQAVAKLATGSFLWGTAMVYAYDGSITGGGPSDPNVRRELMQTGWRPYSLRVTKEDGSVEYRAYDRLDPFGMFYGLAADMAEVAGFVGERDYDQLALDATVALARNLQNKTYLSGLTRALGALAEPEKRGERFLYGMAGSFVPSALNQMLNDDPYMREVRSLADSFRTRTPGLSQDADPVRNILGKPVHVPVGFAPEWLGPMGSMSPLNHGVHPGGPQPNTPEWRATVQPTVHDEVTRQLILHGTSIRPPSPEVGTVDMRTYTSPTTGRSAYDRYLELTGTVTHGGKTLEQSLDRLIGSGLYRRTLTDGTHDHDGSRVDHIRSEIGKYRTLALHQLRREMPDLARDLRAEEIKRLTTKINRNAQVQ